MSAKDDAVKMEQDEKYTMVPSCVNRLPYVTQEDAEEYRRPVGKFVGKLWVNFVSEVEFAS